MWQLKTKHLLHLIWIVALIALYIYLQMQQTSTEVASDVFIPTPTTAGNASGPGQLPSNQSPIGRPSKSTGCTANGALPDSACTPGVVIANATSQQICQSGYSHGVRNVSEAEKRQVYAAYGIARHTPGQYEVDHLISLELGGSNDIANLWPEAASPKPGFHEKDEVENYLHEQLCSGKLSLEQVQQQVATNWLAVYQQIQGQ